MSYFGHVTLKDIYVTLKQLLNAVVYPPNFDRSLGRTRQTTILESGTVTTVGSVTGVTTVSTVSNVANITSIDSYPGKMQILNNNLTAWSTTCRSRIS